MTLNLCPLCQHPNAASAKACGACGVGLVLFCPHCGTVNDGGLTHCHRCASLLHGDPADTAVPPPVAAHAPPAPQAGNDRAARKAAVRAAVRRALLSNDTPQSDPSTAVNVLVLDRDDGSRERLCTLLKRFGFTAHPAVRLAEAAKLLDSHGFVAAFLEISFDAGDNGIGVELCRRVKQSTSPIGDRSPALFVLSEQPRAVDRVRASLAGCDAFVTKPPTRGGVARALESCGLSMPADPRRRDRQSSGPSDRQRGEVADGEPAPP